MRVNLTILKKGLILVSFPLLLQMGFIAFVALMESGNADANKWSLHAKEILGQAETVLTKLLNAETGIRGYILTGDVFFAEPYDLATYELPVALKRLELLVSDNPERLAQVEQIATKAARFLAWHRQNHELVFAGAREKAVARAITASGKTQMDDLRADIDAFVETEHRLDRARSEAVLRARQNMQWVLLGGTAASLVGTLLLACLFSRGISRRLKALAENAQRLAKGQELAPPLHGNDEIAIVDQAFRAMERELGRSQRTLTEQTRLLQLILDSMGDGVVVADETGKFLLWNPMAERIVGLGATSAAPEDWPATYGVFLPDGITPFPAEDIPLLRAIRGEECDQVEQYIRNPRLPDGKWIAVTGRPLRDGSGACKGGVVVFHDISDRKRAEGICSVNFAEKEHLAACNH